MKKRNLAVVSILFLSYLAFGSGGEIGNPRYVDFSNRIDHYKTRYPRLWQRVELGNSVSFVDPDDSDGPATAVNIQVTSQPDVQALSDLKAYAQTSTPGKDWIQTEVSGLQGWVTGDSDQQNIELLRSPGNVVSIRIRAASDPSTSQEVGTILGSLKFE